MQIRCLIQSVVLSGVLGVLALVALISGSVLSGCGTANVCQGNSCDCPGDSSCAFGSVSGDCSFNCQPGSTCSGVCSGNLAGNCAGTSCTLSGGEGSRFNCISGTCNFTCTGACSAVGGTVNCSGGTTASVAGCS